MSTIKNKHHGLTVDDVENGEANEDNSDSDSETNMVRYYQWKRGDDDYLTKLVVRLIRWLWLAFVAVNGGNSEGAYSL